MKRNTVSGIMLTLLLTSMLVLTFNIQPVKAIETIYIRADGSIDPPTAPILTVDNVTYTLTDDITSSSHGIIVERDNIIVDGDGYTLQGSVLHHELVGFYLISMNNVTVRNQNIKGFDYGIVLSSSSGNNVSGNNVTNNFNRGVWLYYSSDNSVSGNNVTAGSGVGIAVEFSSDNNVSGNTVTGNYYGIVLSSSSNNSVCGNKVTSNDDDGIVLKFSSDNNFSSNDVRYNYGMNIEISYSTNNTFRGNIMGGYSAWNFGVYGDSLSHFVHDVDVSNTVDGKPVYYWVNAQDATVPLDAGYVALVNSTRITVQNLNLPRNGQSILLACTTNTTITQNNATNNRDSSIWLWSSSNNTISGNNVTGGMYVGPGDGIVLVISSNNTISSNKLANNNGYGIRLQYSSNNNVCGNKLTNNHYPGVSLESSSGNNVFANNATANGWGGISLSSSSLNNVFANNATGNGGGIGLSSSSLNSVFANTATNNSGFGIELYSSSNNNNVSGNTAIGNDDGIVLASSSNNIISSNNVSNNDYWGIGLHSSSNNNSVTGNNAGNNNGYGIELVSSYYNTVFENTATNNYVASIGIHSSSNGNTVSGNKVTNNDNVGILLYSSSGNNVSENNIADNHIGVWLESSSTNAFYHNDFINNAAQVSTAVSANAWDDGYPSGGNYWSDYIGIDVKKGTSQDQPGSDGIGDTPYVIDDINRDRYPLMNPYGSPPLPAHELIITATTDGTTNPVPGTYTYSEGQTVLVQAISDMGYILDHWELDGTNVGSANPYSVFMEKNHALHAVFRVAFHDVAVTNVAPSKTVLGQGYSLTINVTVANQGDYTDTFNVTLYADRNATIIGDEYIIGTQPLTLKAGDSTIVFFLWNNTSLIELPIDGGIIIGPKGNYTISAVADEIPGETDTTDNTFVDGWVMVAMVGDIASIDKQTGKVVDIPDGKVDIVDIAKIARLFGVIYPNIRYDPDCDITGPITGVPDGKIDIRDIATVAKHFGEVDP